MKQEHIQIKYILFPILGFLSLGFVTNQGDNKDKHTKIQWIENLEGDFNFRTQWSYPEGVFRNIFGQLSCDGLCPSGIELMIDNDGKIFADSLNKFYQLIDTTHLFHSMQCEAQCYEWSGTDFVTAKQIRPNHVRCHTLTNSGTHCSLILELIDDICIPTIELNSINATSDALIYYCKSGYIKIDKELWKQGILKAEFNFDFKDANNLDQNIFWKGKIYTIIEKAI